MPNQPRKHHYVPKFYLAGFTKSGSVDGNLYVLDQRQRWRWGPATPVNVAHQRDFYAIDARSDADRMVVEKTFGEIEATCSRVIRDVIERKEMPAGEDRDILLNFVALMAVRVPGIRNTVSGFIDDVVKSLGRTMLDSELGWQHFKGVCEASGEKVDFTREEMKAFVDGDDYTANLDQSWHVGMMLELGSKLVPALAQRHWSIWIAGDDVPDLTCSDRPVCLTWYTSSPPSLPPGFALAGTAVIMPVNRRIAISGTFEEQPLKSALDKYDVATVNRGTRKYANQVYSSEAEFVWAMTEEQIGNATDLLDLLEKGDSKE
jgi:hypothetical protein